jgi:hypothetical protein
VIASLSDETRCEPKEAQSEIVTERALDSGPQSTAHGGPWRIARGNHQAQGSRVRGLDGLGGILARARLRQRRALVGLLESVGGPNASRLLQWHSTNLAALLATFGTSKALFYRMQRGIPPAQMGQQIGIGLALMSAGGTLQMQQVLPEFIGKPSDIEIACHSRYCI